MELIVKIIIDFQLQSIFAKTTVLDVSQALSSPLTTINQTFFYKQQESYIAVFWNGGSKDPVRVLPV